MSAHDLRPSLTFRYIAMKPLREYQRGKSVICHQFVSLTLCCGYEYLAMMFGYRHRVAWRKAIFVLIACALVFVSSAQQFVVARSLATAEPSHANQMQEADMAGMTDHSHHTGGQGQDDTNGHLTRQAGADSPEPQNGPCCELSCVTFAIIATATIEIASPVGQSHPAVVFNDMTSHEVFDLMRPPRV